MGISSGKTGMDIRKARQIVLAGPIVIVLD
jgi:hypothetical protein